MAENGIGDFYFTDADEVAEIGGVRVPPVIVPSAANQVAPADATSPSLVDDVTESFAGELVVPEEPEPTSEWEGEVGALSAEEPEVDLEPVDEPELVPEVEPQLEQELDKGLEQELEPAAPQGPEPEPEPEAAPEAEPEPTAPDQPEPVVTAEEPLVAAAVPVVDPLAAATPQVPASSEGLTREQRLVYALDALMDASDDIAAAALVSLDGFIMASALPEGMHEDKVGAMSAAILGLGERAAIELGRGNLTQVFIEGEGGYVVLIAVGDRAVLTVLAGEQAKLGLVLYDMRTAAETIARLLG